MAERYRVAPDGEVDGPALVAAVLHLDRVNDEQAEAAQEERNVRRQESAEHAAVESEAERSLERYRYYDDK